MCHKREIICHILILFWCVNGMSTIFGVPHSCEDQWNSPIFLTFSMYALELGPLWKVYFIFSEFWLLSWQLSKLMQLLVQALVISSPDYCNSLLPGLPASVTKPLQRIQSAAVCLIYSLPKFSRVSSLLFSGGTNSRPESGQQSHSPSSTKDSRLDVDPASHDSLPPKIYALVCSYRRTLITAPTHCRCSW